MIGDMEQLEALADLPEDVVLGGKTFKIYPVSLTKIVKLGKILESVSGLIGAFSAIKGDDKSLKESGLLPELLKSADSIAEAILMVSGPNLEEGVPEYSQDQIEKIRNILTVAGLGKVLAILIKQSNFMVLLKNVMSLRSAMPSSPGADLSQPLSESQDGPLATS